MGNLLEKVYNCYLYFINGISKGNIDQDYKNLFGSVLFLKNNIENIRLEQCMETKLNCPIVFPIEQIDTGGRVISWSLSSQDYLNNSFVWNNIAVEKFGIYTINTTQTPGFNFIYISVPQDVNVSIKNSLDIEIFNSTLPQNLQNQLFSLAGTVVTSTGEINNVYKKDDVFNTFNPVTFKIKLF